MTALISSTEISPGDIIAVGDIHGRYDLLELFLDHVCGTEATVILLGDLIDRGGQDIQVLEKVRELLNDPSKEGLSNFFCLMGNHEDMFLNACNGSSQDFFLWLQNGGNFDQFAEMQEHLYWLEGLPIYMTLGETLFVHAGIVPGQNPFKLMERNKADTLMWMREPFLTQGPQFEKWSPTLKQVVFGHTPKFDQDEGKPYTIPDGICIDSGAFFTGVLTSYNVTKDTFCQYKANA